MQPNARTVGIYMEVMAPMTNSDFYTWVAVINKQSSAWLHEGVVMKLNRNKGDETIHPEVVRRFCREVGGDLKNIEDFLTT